MEILYIVGFFVLVLLLDFWPHRKELEKRTTWTYLGIAAITLVLAIVPTLTERKIPSLSQLISQLLSLLTGKNL